MTHVLSTFNTTPLVRSVIEPLLPFDPMPELKFDIERTAIGIKNDEIIRKKDGLYSLPCVKKYGGGLLKNGSLKKRRAFVSYPRSGNTWTRGLILSLFGFYIGGFLGNTIWKYFVTVMANILQNWKIRVIFLYSLLLHFFIQLCPKCQRIVDAHYLRKLTIIVYCERIIQEA